MRAAPLASALALLVVLPCIAGGEPASSTPPEWRDGYCRRAAAAQPGRGATPRFEYSVANTAAECIDTDRLWFEPRLAGVDATQLLPHFLAGLPRWLATLEPGGEPYWRTRFPDAESRQLLPRAQRVQVRELALTNAAIPWYPAADLGDRDDIVRFYAILVVDTAAGRSELRLTADYDRGDGSIRVYVQSNG